MSGLGDDSTQPDLSSLLPSPTEDVAAGGSTVAYEPAPPISMVPSGTTIDPNVVKGLQTAINQFYGVAIGSPLTVDGIVGQDTVGALQTILNWMPSMSFDPSSLESAIGASPTVASVEVGAAQASNILDWIAQQNNYTQNPATASPPSIPAAQTSSGLIAPSSVPTSGPSQDAMTTFLGLGIPNWVFYVAGGLLVAGVAIYTFRTYRERRELQSYAET